MNRRKGRTSKLKIFTLNDGTNIIQTFSILLDREYRAIKASRETAPLDAFFVFIGGWDPVEMALLILSISA